MRRLHTARSDDPDPASLQGYDTPILEGDAVEPSADAASSLRPFGREMVDQGAGVLPGDDGRAPVLERARRLASQGRRLEAIQLLRQHDGPRDEALPIGLELARLLAEAGDSDDSLVQLTAVLHAHPTSADALVARGALYAKAGEAALAERDLTAAVKCSPNHWPARHYLGILRLRKGAAREAIASLEEAERLAPDDGEVKLALGEALVAVKDFDGALAKLEAAGARLPRDPRPWTMMGRILDRLGRTDEAERMHQRAREARQA